MDPDDTMLFVVLNQAPCKDKCVALFGFRVSYLNAMCANAFVAVAKLLRALFAAWGMRSMACSLACC